MRARGRCGSRTPGWPRVAHPIGGPARRSQHEAGVGGDFPRRDAFGHDPAPPAWSCRCQDRRGHAARLTGRRGRPPGRVGVPRPRRGHRGSDQRSPRVRFTIWHRQPTSVGRLLRADAGDPGEDPPSRLRASPPRPQVATARRPACSCNERPGHQVGPAPQPAGGQRRDRTGRSSRSPAPRLADVDEAGAALQQFSGSSGDPLPPVCRRAGSWSPVSGAVGSASGHTRQSDRRGP